MPLVSASAPGRTVESDRPRLARDRYGRPLITPATGGDPVPYTRASSLGKALDDETGLIKWKQRMTAIGVAARRDLILAVNAHRDDKSMMGDLVEKAMDAAESGAAATAGTALHELMDAYDKGRTPYMPEEYRADVAAYREATSHLEFVRSETFVVDDELRVAGTYDNLFRVRHPLTAPDGSTVEPGTLLIADKKGLSLSTPLPTPTGWTTMGDVAVGDQVIGSDGRPCTVTEKSNVKRIGTYVVTFDDGAQVTCDAEHIWWVNGGGHGAQHKITRPVGIEEIRSNFRSNQGQAWWRVPLAEPVDLPEVDLTIDPYLLGCWLGDGSVRDGVIHKTDDLFDVLASDGHELGVRQADKRSNAVSRTVVGLTSKLRELDLLHAKRVPPAYLRASIGQRTRLLQGLMDTDGCWNVVRDRAVFTTTDAALARQVEELLLTLGQNPHVAAVAASGFNVTTTAYHVEFLPLDLVPFRLPRKRDKVNHRVSTTRARRRLMVSVDPGPDVETACIAVDSPNSTYLCDDRMVPTHNTGAEIKFGHTAWAVQLATYAHGVRYDIETGERGEPEPISRQWGLVIHVPVMSGTATVYWINLAVGRELGRLSVQVREARKTKTMLAADLRPSVEWRIAHAVSRAELVSISNEEEDRWTEDRAMQAKARWFELRA